MNMLQGFTMCVAAILLGCATGSARDPSFVSDSYTYLAERLTEKPADEALGCAKRLIAVQGQGRGGTSYRGGVSSGEITQTAYGPARVVNRYSAKLVSEPARRLLRVSANSSGILLRGQGHDNSNMVRVPASDEAIEIAGSIADACVK